MMRPGPALGSLASSCLPGDQSMYEAYFHLQKRPFAATPDSTCCFTPGLEPALGELLQNARLGQGIGVLTGIPGIGKTLLCRRLIAELGHEFIVLFLGSASFSTRRALLQTILYELELPYNGLEEQELRLALQAFVKNLAEDGGAILLVVDEAHLLSERLLEEIRSLAILAEDGQPPVRVILAGSVALEEKLTSPTLEALRQLITIQFCLEPLSTDQSMEYIRHRIHWAGGDADEAFAPDALLAVARASGGIPRCLNQLSDHSLLLAFVGDSQQVTVEHVHDALQDLRQLPLHWQETLVSSGSEESTEAETELESSEQYDGDAIEEAADAEDIGSDSANLATPSDAQAYSIEIGAAGTAFDEQLAHAELEHESVTEPALEAEVGMTAEFSAVQPTATIDSTPVEEPVAEDTITQSASEPAREPIPCEADGEASISGEVPHPCECGDFSCAHRIWEPAGLSHPDPFPQQPAISWHQPIYLVEEEMVFDRYAEIDSGFSFSPAYQNAPVGTPPRTVASRAVREESPVEITNNRPDETLETRILPLMDRLAYASANEFNRPEVPEQTDNSLTGTALDAYEPDMDGGTLEDQVYFDVFEVCSEVRQAILNQLPPEDVAHAPATEMPTDGAPFDVILPEETPRDFMAAAHEPPHERALTELEVEGSDGDAKWADQPEAHATEIHRTIDRAIAERPAPNFKWVFSMLRRKAKSAR